MAEGAGRLVVADAGPLIHLDELGCLHLLSLDAPVLVPDAVWREVERHRPSGLAAPGISLERRDVLTSGKVDALAAIYTLHTGERQALALCVALSDAWLLTDDTAARLAAKALDIEAHGTLGVLIRAIRTQQMNRKDVIAMLRSVPHRSSLHVRAELLDEVIRIVLERDPESGSD